MQNNNKLDNHYNLIRFLDKGGFSKIYLVYNLNDNNRYAARIRRNDLNDLNLQDESFQQEIEMTSLASGLNNPYIIHLNRFGVGTMIESGTITNDVNYMILEYCSRGDLFKYIYKIKGFIERHAKYIFKKILLGVQALHRAGYCHRNLKLQNILLDHNYNPKISCFIFVTKFQQNNQPIMLNDFVGTMNYASPQIFSHNPYNGEKADIFSLGVILFILVTGILGFSKASKQDLYYRFIMLRFINKYWNTLNDHLANSDINLSDEFKDLYISMVQYNENDRPNIEQILNHHWFDEINNLNNEDLNELEIDVRNEFLSRVNQIDQDNQDNQDNDDPLDDR